MSMSFFRRLRVEYCVFQYAVEALVRTTVFIIVERTRGDVAVLKFLYTKVGN